VVVKGSGAGRTGVLIGACLLTGAPLTALHGWVGAAYALLASTVLALAGAASCALSARRSAGRGRWGWALLAVGCLGWGLGNAYWTWNELVVHAEVLFPSPADFGFITFPAAGAVGVWLLSGRSSLGSKLTSLLDGLIVTGSLFVISWVTTLRSVYEAGGDSVLAFAVSLAYPIGDLILATMVFLLATRSRPTGRSAIWLLICGMLAMAVADTLFAMSSLHGTYASGSLSDAGWVVGFAAFTLAGWTTARQPMDLGATGFMRRWHVLLPYVPFGAAALISGVQLVRNDVTDAVRTGVLLGVLALILVRQLLTLTHNSALTEQLRHQAYHDPLTGLANRSLIAERLEQALAGPAVAGRRPTMLYLDLDDFKLVNDTLGHDVGDGLLRGVADRMRASFGAVGVVARLGGDEFAVLLDEASDVVDRTRELLESLRRPFTVGAHRVTVSASVGIATAEAMSGRPATSEDVRKHVDLAMYAAKAGGKNTFAVFEPRMREQFDREMQLRAQLTAALARGDLHVEYQPIVALADGRVAGVEALARWHAGAEDVPPAMFVPVAERAGLIPALGMFVLDRACAEFQCSEPKPATYLSVNVSPLQLIDPTFPGQVLDILHRHAFATHRLVLEITENALADESHMIKALSTLRRAGIRIAIDDFGTGYSSLRHLHRLPADIIKIDRSYVRDIADDDGTRRLVGTLIQLFTDLGLTVVVEGVEDERQARTLLDTGCRFAQGHLFSPPVPAVELSHGYPHPSLHSIGGRLGGTP